MQIQNHLKSITNLTSTVIAVCIAVMIPAGYFLTSYHYEYNQLEAQSNLSSDALSRHFYEYPDTWYYQDTRIEDILMQGVWHRHNINYKVETLNNEEIISIGNTLQEPVIINRMALEDGEKVIGWVETKISLRPLLMRTTFVLCLSLLLAWSVRLVLRILPFAALERVMMSLKESHLQLEIEAREKAIALEEQKKLSEAIEYQAMHDVLTGLPNRIWFNQHLNKIMNEANASYPMVSVMIIDLNRFKEVNDALGHHFGDLILVEVSKRIDRALPENAKLAKLGGDEFALFISDTHPNDAKSIAQKITNALKSHIVIDDYYLAISASIGISLFPHHGQTAEKLMKHADVAMYQAKKNTQPFCVYDPDFDNNSPNRLTLAADLRKAIDENELFLNYQPKVDLKTGKITGVEALSRWRHPIYGLIAPDVFIPLAEQAGMINLLTILVLDNALDQLSKWHAKGIDIGIAVNISTRSLMNEDLPRQIKQILGKYDFPSEKLTLEITESSIMIDPLKSIKLIQGLAEWGVNISVDDFGTGYSSLTYLKKLTVNELKIDRSFVMNMLKNSEDQIIVKSTIDLGHNLNLLVVAEGIEDEKTNNMLKGFGCDVVQGFYHYQPMTADMLDEILLKSLPSNTIPFKKHA